MPISSPGFPLRNLSQDEFDRIDKVVMNHAYAAQNKLGRLFDERVYENEVAGTLRAAGHEVHTQVPVKLTHESFEKTYYLDLVADHMPYEFKTVAALLSEHEAQALHYAMLLDVRRVKLLNFRTERVQGKVCFAPLDRAGRMQSDFLTDKWQPYTSDCERLQRKLREIIAEWGTHLSAHLYNDALIHFSGGQLHCLQRVPVANIGTHLIQSHAPGMAFVVTALTERIPDYRHHLVRLISHLEIKALQWFNLKHSTISCETLVGGMAGEWMAKE